MGGECFKVCNISNSLQWGCNVMPMLGKCCSNIVIKRFSINVIALMNLVKYNNMTTLPHVGRLLGRSPMQWGVRVIFVQVDSVILAGLSVLIKLPISLSLAWPMMPTRAPVISYDYLSVVNPLMP